MKNEQTILAVYDTKQKALDEKSKKVEELSRQGFVVVAWGNTIRATGKYISLIIEYVSLDADTLPFRGKQYTDMFTDESVNIEDSFVQTARVR